MIGAKSPPAGRGIYSVQLTGNTRLRLFPDRADQATFEERLARALRSSGARLHAYVWLECEAHLVIEVGDSFLGRVIQQTVGPYSRQINRRYGQRGTRFARAYRHVRLSDPRQLPELVRHVHLAPVGAGLVADAVNYPASGHRAYLGLTPTPWLTTRLVLKLLRRRGLVGRDGYARFVAQGDDPTIAGRNAGNRKSPLRVAEDEAFYRWLAHPHARQPSLDAIIQAVCRLMALDPSELHASKRPMLPLAHALITWHATRNAGVPLNAVARHLHRAPSTLHAGMQRHRSLRPRLFEMPLLALLKSDARIHSAQGKRQV